MGSHLNGNMIRFMSTLLALKGGAGKGTPSVEQVMVRMGLHAGEVIKEGADFFGRKVIMAARVASQAQGGEILASSVLKALLQGSEVSWGEKRTVQLKGLSGEHEIWAVESVSRHRLHRRSKIASESRTSWIRDSDRIRESDGL
jgi:class 3 adenylate cyclase